MLKKTLIAVAALLVVITGIVAALHLKNQDKIACLVIRQEEREFSVSFEELDQAAFSGTLIDGKGDQTHHTYTGILLGELLEKKGINLDEISGVTVTSADQYSATFTVQELMEPDKVYVAITADGETIQGIDPGNNGVQVIAFAEPNSRRCVRYAQIITIE